MVKFWNRNRISASGRKAIIDVSSDKKLKKIFERLVETQSFIEIGIEQNVYRVVETIYYNSNGQVIHTDKFLGNWNSISPNSIIKRNRDAVIYLLGRKSRTPSYTPTPAPPQSQPTLRTPKDRQEYQQLQEYYRWLTHQEDFPEFSNWVVQRLALYGVTVQNLDSYLSGYINGGGRYAEIQKMVAGWYREFYQERYGRR